MPHDETALSAPAIVWLRDDLRLDDNPALAAGAESGRELLLVYVLDEQSEGVRRLGGAARWWLHHSLERFAAAVAAAGGGLTLFRASPIDVLPALAEAARAAAVFWNRRYGPAERAVDEAVQTKLAEKGIRAAAFNGHLMHEPRAIIPKSGGHFKVFTPFWRAEQALGETPAPTPAPTQVRAATTAAGGPPPVSLAALELLPTKPDWAGGLRETWQPGESAAIDALHDFIDHRLAGYAENRDRPGTAGTSRLSPHLRFGEVSVRRVRQAVADAARGGKAPSADAEKFLAELAWRDFSYNILFHFPDLPSKSFQPRFEAFPWQRNPAALQAWQRGLTGYPIVDAGMRELWHTGIMHNRVRLIAGSFLVKHLLIDWRAGESWFWDCLCDADLANNTANWQWVAGSGADAAPYFRIFNPILQGKRFDPEGAYVRRHVPELGKLSDRWIHEPWTAPEQQLSEAGVVLGETYPAPIVDHKIARQRALDAFRRLHR